jgi:predicted SAM-dependent methyltransferase
VWHKILKPGGEMEMILPDMEHHIRQWLNPDRKTTIVKRSGAENSNEEQEAIKGFWGGQRGDFLDTWDVHKSGYDFTLLKDILEEHGFLNVKREKSAAKNLRVKARKYYGS